MLCRKQLWVILSSDTVCQLSKFTIAAAHVSVRATHLLRVLDHGLVQSRYLL